MTRDRSDLRLALIRYQAALFLFLAVAPLAVAAPLLGRSGSTSLTTGIGFPLLGDGKIPTWLLACIYVATITGPLLSWSHADIEAGAGRFERLSFPAPHLLASRPGSGHPVRGLVRGRHGQMLSSGWQPPWRSPTCRRSW